MSPAQVLLVVVSDRSTVTGGVAQALDNLTYASDRRLRLPGDIVATRHWAPESERRVVARARRYLEHAAAGYEALTRVRRTSRSTDPWQRPGLTWSPRPGPPLHITDASAHGGRTDATPHAAASPRPAIT